MTTGLPRSATACPRARRGCTTSRSWRTITRRRSRATPTWTVAASGRFGDIRFVYLDTRDTLGAMLEVLDDRPGIRAFFGAIRKAAERWDGDPATLIRNL